MEWKKRKLENRFQTAPVDFKLLPTAAAQEEIGAMMHIGAAVESMI